MSNKAKKQPKKPLGSPVEWSDSDLDTLARVAPSDLKAAAALWSNEAPAKLKSLLQAKVEETGNA
jgi:hypothetical protein